MFCLKREYSSNICSALSGMKPQASTDWATAQVKHISHFVDAGAKVLSLKGEGQSKVEFLAFANPDGSLVISGSNPNQSPANVTVELIGAGTSTGTLRHMNVVMPPASLSTWTIAA